MQKHDVNFRPALLPVQSSAAASMLQRASDDLTSNPSAARRVTGLQAATALSLIGAPSFARKPVAAAVR